MKYTWSEDQRRGLTFGSTVETRCGYVLTPELGISVAMVDPRGGLVDSLSLDPSPVGVEHFDPSTLLPPSIEWIRELARGRLGDDAHVYDLETSIDIEWNFYAREISLEDVPGLDRFRAAVAAIVALGNAGLGAR